MINLFRELIVPLVVVYAVMLLLFVGTVLGLTVIAGPGCG